MGAAAFFERPVLSVTVFAAHLCLGLSPSLVLVGIHCHVSG